MPEKYNDQQINKLLQQALDKLICCDAYLLMNNMNERAICFRLGFYLQQLFSPNYTVDCEYNRIGSGQSDRGKLISHLDNYKTLGCGNKCLKTCPIYKPKDRKMVGIKSILTSSYIGEGDSGQTY